MKTFIRIDLPTGHTYEIPTNVVAKDRAACCHKQCSDEFPTLDEAMADTVKLFDDGCQVKDWALKNMDTAELMKHARLVRFTPPAVDLQSGKWSHHDTPAIIPQLDAGTVLQSPVEMALAAMAAHRNLCQVVTLAGEDGQPAAAVALIQGSPGVVGAYVGALTHLTNAYMQPAPAAEQQH